MVSRDKGHNLVYTDLQQFYKPGKFHLLTPPFDENLLLS